ncbi:winged helix-turn-helix domain-containing protein [Kribbella sp. NBC_01245]|uniref:BTAD domain-containing putative transcriptional regulator n=1 Tax=Kribbella sp. NBC_01245 TaxID=2903578 RepID=UPI002E285C5A|nr:BTAD domain-containing putative transcriptional regulator [Kribbella sp. NBC_01245]
MRFGVLGPVAVWTDDGRPVAIPGVKVRALLADLLVHEGKPVSADRLVEDIWGDDQPANPIGTLQVKASQLRRALEDAEPGGRELIVSGPAGYSIRAETDAGQFQTLLDQGRPAEAEALWRGPAYADFADEEFARAAITRLTEQRLTAHEEQAETRLNQGDHHRLADELASLVAANPLRERLRAIHLKALYRAGRQAEALAGYDQLRELLADELGLDPSPALAELHQALLTQDPVLVQDRGQDAPTRRRTSNLPAQRSELIGRDDAVADIRAQLAKHRLVTLTGPGGVGKTRLALAIATADEQTFPDGVRWIELAAVEAPDALDATASLIEVILTALGVRETAGTANERLAAAVQSRELLLVLDNCEHLIDQVAEIADSLLQATSTIKLLATSREPLALPDEVVWNVPPLDLPTADDLASLNESGAVQLFTARAKAADRSFALNDTSAAAVSTVCRRLDGIPFALELAANRVRALGVQGLVDRLDDRFRLLATGHRGAAPRQQTLLAMIDWSWELLTDVERATLRRLALHVDGCTTHAAEAIGGDADVLGRLVDRSLVVPVHQPNGPRFHLLESIAAYGVERLHEAGEYDEIRAAHHRYYLEQAERNAEELYGAGQHRALTWFDAEAGNLRSALDGAVADGDADQALRLVDALAWYWFLRGRITTARQSIAAALATNGASIKARARAWEAGFAVIQGEDATADLSDLTGKERARAEWFLAYTRTDLGDVDGADELLASALRTFQDTGDRWGEAAVLASRAKLAHVRGDLAAIERDGQRSLDLFTEVGDLWGRLQATEWLGARAELVGEHDAAAKLYTEGLQMAEELGLWPEVAGRLGFLGWNDLQRGDYEKAEQYGEQALRLAAEHGQLADQVLARIVLAFAARRLGDLPTAATRLRNLIEGAPDNALYLGIVQIELGYVLDLQGDLAQAAACREIAYQHAVDAESPRGQAFVLEGLANTASLAGHNEVAAELLGATNVARQDLEIPRSLPEQADFDQTTERVRAALGDSEFEARFVAGSKHKLVDAWQLTRGIGWNA